MTSNRPIEDWGKIIGDVPATSAILDRFLSHSYLIEIKGKSFRIQHATCKNMNYITHSKKESVLIAYKWTDLKR
jgi:DNA replication protein DnaC